MLRREFLSILPAAAAAGASGSSLLPGCQTNAWPIAGFPQFLDVLGRIRELGYVGFETTFRNLQAHFADAAGTRPKIAALKLRFLGIHIFLNGYDPQSGLAPRELIESVVRGGAALGAERLILSGQGLSAAGPPDPAAVQRKAAALAWAAELSRKAGIGMAYHNHNVEFTHGSAEIEGLLRQTDPALVRLILDAGHAFVGGANVVEFFARHHRRIDGMHLRDFRGGRQVPLGQGEFDLRPLAAAARKADWSGWIINEEERPNDVRPGDAVVKPARQHIRKIFGI